MKIFILLAVKTTEMSPIPSNHDIYYDGHLLYAMTHGRHQSYRLYYTFFRDNVSTCRYQGQISQTIRLTVDIGRPNSSMATTRQSKNYQPSGLRTAPLEHCCHQMILPLDNDRLLHAMARETHMGPLGQRNALGPTDCTTPHRPHPSYVLEALLGMGAGGNPHCMCMAIPDADFLALNLANRGSAFECAPNDPLLLPRQAMLAKNPAIKEVTCRLAIASL